MTNWVYRVSDGQLILGVYDPAIINTAPTGYAMVSISDDIVPDPRAQRVASPTSLRAATAIEQAAYDSAVLDAKASQDFDADLRMQAVIQLNFEERMKLVVRGGQSLLSDGPLRERGKAIYRSLLK